ncbi:hypothetical protein BH23GEM9_BH23GEM9_33040 [soil metagenome]
MNVQQSGAVFLMLCMAVTTAACGTAPRTTGGPAPVPAGEAAPVRAAMPADSLAELDALFRERLAESRGRFTEADVRFMSDMIAHHAQALAMVEMAVPGGASPALQTLAARIRTGQEDEIALMQQWLRERGRPVPDADPGAGHHAHHVVAMPGMLSPEQMTELARARGQQFDRYFLTLMIEHHRGAVVMVDTLMATDGAAQDPTVFRIASDVKADQTAEIARMQRMLATLLGGRDPR